MRILMVTIRFPPDIGGAETAAAILSKALAKRGHIVNVVTGADLRRPDRLSWEGVSIHRFPLPSGPLSGPRYVLRAARAALSLGAHDIIHAHMASGPAAAGVLLSKLSGSPLIVTPYSGAGPGGGNLADVASRRTGFIRVATLRRWVSAFVAISPHIRHNLELLWRVSTNRIFDIPNPVDLNDFSMPDASTKDLLRQLLIPLPGRAYLYVGRLHPIKGVDVLIQAWVAAREPGVLIIVGDGPARGRLEAMAPPSVRFVGKSPDVSSWYKAVDVFVLPSWREGLSLALLEALASGLPVIATKVGDTTMLKGAGVVVPPGDVAALARALQNPPLPPKQTWRLADRYEIRSVVNRHIHLYECLLRGRD